LHPVSKMLKLFNFTSSPSLSWNAQISHYFSLDGKYRHRPWGVVACVNFKSRLLNENRKPPGPPGFPFPKRILMAHTSRELPAAFIRKPREAIPFARPWLWVFFKEEALVQPHLMFRSLTYNFSRRGWLTVCASCLRDAFSSDACAGKSNWQQCRPSQRG